jgi:malate/lactate dehydrogenase
MPLEEFARLRGIDLAEPVRNEIDGKVRGAAYTIISGTSATNFGIGSTLARIVDVILHKLYELVDELRLLRHEYLGDPKQVRQGPGCGRTRR